MRSNSNGARDSYGADSDRESSVWCECSGDFALPEYMPEISKMLKVEGRVVPSGKYIGGERAEFSGNVVYGVLYTGDDGVPFFTTLSSEYEYSVPIPSGAELSSDSVWEETVIESTNVRPSGPRKLSIRSKLKATPHFSGSLEWGPPIFFEGDEYDCQVLSEKRTVMSSVHFESGEFELEQTLRSELREGAQPVGCDAKVLVGEVRQTLGGVNCRGEVEYKIYYYDIEGGRRELFCDVRTLRFEKDIACETCDGICGIRAYGRVVSTEISVAEDTGEVGICFLICISGDYMSESEREYIKDVYLCGGGYDVEYSVERYGKAVLCKNANFSFHAQRSVQDQGVCGVCTSYGTATLDGVSVKDGKAHVTGDVAVDCVLLQNNDEVRDYVCVSVPVPFKCEIPVLYDNDRLDVRCSLEVGGIRARLEKDALSVDTELFLSLYIAGGEEITTVCRAETTEDAPDRFDGSVRVYYPSGDDTLWSVAKKYSVPILPFAEKNGVDAGDPDSKTSLDGVYCLVVCKGT